MTEPIRLIEAYASKICAGFHCNEVIERFGYVPPRVKGEPRVSFEVQHLRCCYCAADPAIQRHKAARLATERVERIPVYDGGDRPDGRPWRLDGAPTGPRPCAV